MKIINILPLQIFSFDLSQELLEDTLNKVKALQWCKNISNNITNESLNHNDSFRDLHLVLGKHLEEVKNHLKLPFEKIVLTQSWANRTSKGEQHHGHKHPNSFMSGIIYLTSHKSGVTYFQTENIWKNNLFFGVNNKITNQITPEAGKIIIFPSQLFHGVTKIEDDEERYTIAFNAFPSGKIGFFAAGMVLDTKQFIS